MYQFIKFASAFAFIFLVTAMSTNAQSTTRFEAEIPFEFKLGKTSYEAGKYKLTVTTTSSGLAHVRVTDIDNSQVTGAIARPERSAAEATPQIVFEVDGSDRTLALVEISSGRYQLVKASPIRSDVNRKAIKLGSGASN